MLTIKLQIQELLHLSHYTYKFLSAMLGNIDSSNKISLSQRLSIGASAKCFQETKEGSQKQTWNIYEIFK